MHWHKKALAYGLWLSLLSACSDDDSAKSTAGIPAQDSGGHGGNGDPGNHGDGDFGGGAGGDGDGDDEPPALPPEIEEVLSFDTPRAGKTSVYVPNPTTNRVAVVNAQTYAIESLVSGVAPKYLATVPGEDVALVLNVGTRDASLLRTVQGRTQAKRIEVNHDANAIAVAPSGKYAVVYFDARNQDSFASSFQDVTVVNLQAGQETSRGVSVGFRPREVRFSRDGNTAFVVTEDGISVIDLTAAVSGPTIARLVSVGDGLSDKLSTDFQITPDGTYAFARRDGESVIRRVDLATGEIRAFALAALVDLTPPADDADDDTDSADAGVSNGGADGGATNAPPPNQRLDLTDIDLTPDGAYLLAVVRNRGALLRIPVPGGFDDPSLIETTFVRDQLVGSVSVAPTGSLAVAYTTVGNIEGIVLVDLAQGGATRGVRLRKAVRAVALSEDGTRALVLHTAVAGLSTNDEEARIDASEGYSLVDTQTGFAKLQLTPTRIREQDLVVLPDASRMFALMRHDASGVSALEVADLGSFQATTLQLAKPPVAIGLVPGLDRLFIGQETPGGMITFVNTASGEVERTVSGFELASRIPQ
jgi:hypothetical protein